MVFIEPVTWLFQIMAFIYTLIASPFGLAIVDALYISIFELMLTFQKIKSILSTQILVKYTILLYSYPDFYYSTVPNTFRSLITEVYLLLILSLSTVSNRLYKFPNTFAIVYIDIVLSYSLSSTTSTNSLLISEFCTACSLSTF